ncbi:hypothetical protein O0544_14450 [Edwardsiella anguillarum]|nr:hypothetical protein [Edwardsiella anguillarum]
MKYRLAGWPGKRGIGRLCHGIFPHDTQGRSDPLEGFNRAMFSVNYDYLDPYGAAGGRGMA